MYILKKGEDVTILAVYMDDIILASTNPTQLKFLATRPDIAYEVNYLSQFNATYTEEHTKAAKRVLRYL